MGTLEGQLNAVAGSYQPLMLVGENGTAKEQIARAVYLRSPKIRNPFISVDCTVIGDKEWDFLFNHYASPLNDQDGTVFFRHAEVMPDRCCSELLANTIETNLAKRIRLMFSCDCPEDIPMPESAKRIISRLGCFSLHVPTLRSRSDEIPSLAGLCLNLINKELGKQLVGFEPRAGGQSADAILSGRTLEEITLDAVHQTVDACGGNQTMAAKQLGISRSTLWRYLSRA